MTKADEDERIEFVNFSDCLKRGRNKYSGSEIGHWIETTASEFYSLTIASYVSKICIFSRSILLRLISTAFICKLTRVHLNSTEAVPVTFSPEYFVLRPCSV